MNNDDKNRLLIKLFHIFIFYPHYKKPTYTLLILHLELDG